MANPLGLLGMARRAGRLALGEAAVEQLLRQSQARLLLLASDASPNAVRRSNHWAQTHHVALMVMPYTKEEFGGAMGRATCAVASLTDDGFVRAYKTALDEMKT